MDGLKQALYEAALMHHHRICVIQSMVGTPNASIQEKYEMSGSITHTPPNSIVHCLCPKVEPQTYKSKVWEGEGGSEMMSSLQESHSATHLHGQGTVTKSCSLTVNPPRQVGLLQG